MPIGRIRGKLKRHDEMSPCEVFACFIPQNNRPLSVRTLTEQCRCSFGFHEPDGCGEKLSRGCKRFHTVERAQSHRDSDWSGSGRLVGCSAPLDEAIRYHRQHAEHLVEISVTMTSIPEARYRNMNESEGCRFRGLNNA